MPRRIPKDAMTRALEAAGADDELPTDRKADAAPSEEDEAQEQASTEDESAGSPETGHDGDAASDEDDAGADDERAGEEDADEDAADEDAADEDAADADDEEDDGDDEEEDEAMADVPDKLYFRIGEVAQLVGVDAHVLRYWESEFRMKPHRSSSGQRLYRKKDLSRFFRIKRLLHDEGYTIAGARKVLSRGKGRGTSGVDASRIREALGRVQTLRDRILELRDELDPEGRF